MARNSDTDEAKRIETKRSRCPKALELANQLYELAAELGGTRGEQLEALGWAVDDMANRGHEVTREHVSNALEQARLIHEGVF